MTTAAERPEAGPERRLYVVATVHLDTQWRWTIQDTIREFLPATLRRNLELIDRYPFFVVSFEGAFRYMLMKEYYPELFERLRERVADGRWRLAGSMLDSPDVNVVSPESLLRHVLYGNGFFHSEFGRRSCDLFLPDCFGFGHALPSIAAHCGLIGFSSQKFGRWGAPARIPFDLGIWQGPDGHGIVAALRPEGYGEGLNEDLSRARRYVERIDDNGERAGAYVGLKYVGVGDRGGGLDERSMKWLQRSVGARGPIRVVVDGSDQIFRDLDPEQLARLPRHRGELLLPTHGTGCLTSQAELKRRNRRSEQLASAAERSAVMAEWWARLPYPGARLREAWIRFLWHQMHDDLTGTSIPRAYRFTRRDLLLSLREFAAILTHSVAAVATRMDTRCSGQPLVVFNPLSIERCDLVEVPLSGEERAGSLRIVGPDGREVPSQISGLESERPSIVFAARVPAVGVAVYDLRFEESSEDLDTGLSATASGLESQRYRAAIDGDGDLASLVDKTTGRELLADPVRLELLADRSARWPAWEVRFEDLQQADPDRLSAPVRARVVERGPVRVAVEVVRSAFGSTFRQTLRLAAGRTGEWLEVINQVDWRTRGRMCKAAFTLSTSNPVATYDLGLGVIERGNNRREKYEVPAQQWAALTEPSGDGGVSILNDCKYGWDKPHDRTLRLTLLRSPRVLRRFRHQGRQDFGTHRFTYALVGHDNSWQPADTCWQAARLNQPLIPFRTASHPGELGRSVSFLTPSSPQICVEALKRAESGGSLVIRIRELSGRRQAGVGLGFAGRLEGVREVDGMEEELAPVDRRTESGFSVAMDRFAIRSFAVDLTDSAHRPAGIRCRSLELPFDVAAARAQGRAHPRGFDGAGHSYPAELFPQHLEVGGIGFELGPGRSGSASAVICRGQTLELPTSDLDRLHLLAAAVGSTEIGTFRLGDQDRDLEIADYSGFLDRPRRSPRGWRLRRSARRTSVPGDLHEVAWVSTHRHGPDGEDEPYVFCYVFRYVLEVPPGCSTLRLPHNPMIRLFAATLADDRLGATTAAHSLLD